MALQLPTDIVESEPKDNAVAESEENEAKRGQQRRTIPKRRQRNEKGDSDLCPIAARTRTIAAKQLNLGRAGKSVRRSRRWGS